ncbi:MAG: hypothetical protein M1837_002142 [Sclerophora amabilis]|nr:MAG: hypothetical protein M1837_002142 [Sclerophora amabilis]
MTTQSIAANPGREIRLDTPSVRRRDDELSRPATPDDVSEQFGLMRTALTRMATRIAIYLVATRWVRALDFSSSTFYEDCRPTDVFPFIDRDLRLRMAWINGQRPGYEDRLPPATEGVGILMRGGQTVAEWLSMIKAGEHGPRAEPLAYGEENEFGLAFQIAQEEDLRDMPDVPRRSVLDRR